MYPDVMEGTVDQPEDEAVLGRRGGVGCGWVENSREAGLGTWPPSSGTIPSHGLSH